MKYSFIAKCVYFKTLGIIIKNNNEPLILGSYIEIEQGSSTQERHLSGAWPSG